MAASAFAASNESIKVQVSGKIPVRITASSPDLQRLAEQAFSSHGLYQLAQGAQLPNYDFKFTAVSATQVRVDIAGRLPGSVNGSATLTGRTPRHALLRAADVAVEKTNGLNPSLRGFFTARLAFISERSGRSEVCVSDLFLGEGKQLSFDKAPALLPRWSPDGSKVIYTSYYKSRAPDIFVQDPVTGTRSIFADYKGTNMGARFSPNGQQVAMVLTVHGPSEIYVRGAQGGTPDRKTHVDSPKSSPCWSPDGTQIVFAMGEQSQLYRMSAAGGTPQRIGGGYTYMAEPDWNRVNRNKIVCTVREGGRFQIAVVDLTTNQAKIVSKAPFDAVEPSWLADGRHVVCTLRDRSTSVLAILDTEAQADKDKGGVRITSPGDAAKQASVWTP